MIDYTLRNDEWTELKGFYRHICKKHPGRVTVHFNGPEVGSAVSASCSCGMTKDITAVDKSLTLGDQNARSPQHLS